MPRHPLLAARFGLRAIQPATGWRGAGFATSRRGPSSPGWPPTRSCRWNTGRPRPSGLVLGLAGHAVGWPIVRGGSQNLAEALASYFRSLGGEIVTGWRVESLDELPAARAILLDVTPRQVVRIAGTASPSGYVRRLERFRYGAGVFKLDWALSGPIPWRSADCARAGTVHLGGTLDEVAAVGGGRRPRRTPRSPVRPALAAQPLRPDASPPGRHTAWAYCHVPNGSTVDMTDAIEAQVERFAPGFRDVILARHAMAPADFESYNANYIGGDINGGAQDLRQLFTRPVARLVPTRHPLPGLYLCSSSTPPGGGVHGLCGYYAARAALRRQR